MGGSRPLSLIIIIKPHLFGRCPFQNSSNKREGEDDDEMKAFFGTLSIWSLFFGNGSKMGLHYPKGAAP
jgi:hypothetical protein